VPEVDLAGRRVVVDDEPGLFSEASPAPSDQGDSR